MNPTALTTEPAIAGHNLLFSLANGRRLTCWYSRPADQPVHDHETLLAEGVPAPIANVFNYPLSVHRVRPTSVSDARTLWAIFEALYRQDPESFEHRWQFICQHYRR